MSGKTSVAPPLEISRKLFLPGVGAVFFLLLLGCFLFWRPELLLGDGSACRHLDAGTYILTEHQIHTTNYTSALFPDVKAISASFLGDLLFAISYQFGKLNGMVLVAALTIALTAAWCYQFARARGLGAVVALFGLILVITTVSMHWSARTLIFSHLIFLVLFYLAFMSKMNAKSRLLATSLIMLLWVNFHGSFLLGMVMLAARALGNLLDAAWHADQQSMRSFKWDLATIAVCALVICINPNGPAFYTYVTGYLTHPMIMMRSNEWKSLDFGMGLQTWAFLALYAILVSLWAYSGARPKCSDFILINFLFFGGVYTMRLCPYFALAALPVMASPYSSIAEGVMADEGVANGALYRLVHGWFSFEQRIDKQERAGVLPVYIPLSVAAVMAAAFLWIPQLNIPDFDPKKLPVASTQYIIDKHLDGLGFCYDNWGGYLYWRLHRPIFIDDWTDFYPVSFTQEYVQAMMAQPGWQQILDKYKVQYVLVPHAVALGVALSNSPDWKQAFSDPASELFVRRNP